MVAAVMRLLLGPCCHPVLLLIEVTEGVDSESWEYRKSGNIGNAEWLRITQIWIVGIITSTRCPLCYPSRSNARNV